ncbi:MAG: RNA-binding transcriptional accessory protein [Erysipelothrix sp.]|nr:RNA-binding transcriptional accessory protein [Erysipelothrix sp.]
MENKITTILDNELKDISLTQIKTTLSLLEEGNTIPFVARYRKEMTGSLDEVQIKTIQDRYTYLENLETRKEEVIRLIDAQEKLTPELEKEILEANILTKVEDLYRPYRQKRRTLATIAKERGLEPLADFLMSLPMEGDVNLEASKYINEEHEILTVEDALNGAHEILAETVGDSATFRSWIRSFTFKDGILTSTLKDQDKDERKIYEMYYDFREPIRKLASHRVLAVNRAEKEDVVKVEIEVEEAKVLAYLGKSIIGNKYQSIGRPYVMNAYEDAYKRFIKPAIEREIRNELSEKAEEQSIHIFGENLRNLLLQAPLKDKIVMGFDPAFRTGCKLAVVDPTGKVLDIAVIFPHPPAAKFKQDAALGEFLKLIRKHNVEMIAIGNGTASRESESFVANALKELKETIYYLIVNEAGASVYSASAVARKEFPDYEVEERSAISIARRIQDPLAELVKIDPKAVGVGQYQHDVSQKKLETTLSFVVETAVNQVGVNLNTASPQLLEHVSGLTKTTAQNIVTYREENGVFKRREDIKKVPRLGPKAFEQSVGFLRIPESKNILDNTGIHPESYTVTDKILKAFKITKEDLGTKEALEKLEGHENEYSAFDVGKETYYDILEAIKRPGRDFRDELSTPLLRSDVLSMEDLKPGMELQGTVRNVVDFGAFVDIGVKQDGLVHISKLSKSFVNHPTDVVSVGDIVKVWIMEVDLKKERIQLTMIKE